MDRMLRFIPALLFVGGLSRPQWVTEVSLFETWGGGDARSIINSARP
jgi:hypothetical protein